MPGGGLTMHAPLAQACSLQQRSAGSGHAVAYSQAGTLHSTGSTFAESVALTAEDLSAPLQPVTAARRMYADVAGGGGVALLHTLPLWPVHAAGSTGSTSLEAPASSLGAAAGLSAPLAPDTATRRMHSVATRAGEGPQRLLQGRVAAVDAHVFDDALMADFISAPLEPLTAAQHRYEDLVARAAEGLDPPRSLGGVMVRVHSGNPGASGGFQRRPPELTAQRHRPRQGSIDSPALDVIHLESTMLSTLDSLPAEVRSRPLHAQNATVVTTGEWVGGDARHGGHCGSEAAGSAVETSERGTNETEEVMNRAAELVQALQAGKVREVGVTAEDEEVAKVVGRLQQQMTVVQLEQTRQRLLEMQTSLQSGEAVGFTVAASTAAAAATEPAGMPSPPASSEGHDAEAATAGQRRGAQGIQVAQADQSKVRAGKAAPGGRPQPGQGGRGSPAPASCIPSPPAKAPTAKNGAQGFLGTRAGVADRSGVPGPRCLRAADKAQEARRAGGPTRAGTATRGAAAGKRPAGGLLGMVQQQRGARKAPGSPESMSSRETSLTLNLAKGRRPGQASPTRCASSLLALAWLLPCRTFCCTAVRVAAARVSMSRVFACDAGVATSVAPPGNLQRL